MTPNTNSHICPICESADGSEFYQDGHRDYFRCQTCDLVFVHSAQFLSAEDEKARYDLHRNSPDDQGYRRFLSRVFIPIQRLLAPGSCGLDFGSGPGPTLSRMFEEAGHSMAIYDHFYARNPSVLEKQYDFITATEVMEHLHNPKKELDRLWACLKPGARLGIMTKLVLDREAFARWHYKNDPTHVCFFSRSTFEWLAARWQAELTFAGKDVILFYKKNQEL
ncbi:MAG: class I SAM-dependent methyltransferase [Deltaproteobacteria bacterium]|nr:class I SAM-dependent methyltransferase [Deltaproteobacteria bacterium]MBW2596338.1 class I SAM-dependent methyltransferase [Deltaproteobacteria bacterium]MBW2650183.1 class I SAM-dependent methyltransferase [Deltaproteobacteria bacterium]